MEQQNKYHDIMSERSTQIHWKSCRRDVRIENEIGKIFRGSNILEYKSPEDHLNIDTFYKSGAYASLYKAYGETMNERKADDITVSGWKPHIMEFIMY